MNKFSVENYVAICPRRARGKNIVFIALRVSSNFCTAHFSTFSNIIRALVDQTMIN
jgi:hypothetical protein